MIINECLDGVCFPGMEKTVQSVQSGPFADGGGDSARTPHLPVELVLRFCQGDVDAFEAIYAVEAKRHLKYTTSLVRSENEACEICQDVWSEVWLRRSNLNNADSFLGWLYSITRKMVALHYRKNHRRVRLLLFDDIEEIHLGVMLNMADMRPGPEELARQKQWQQALDNEIGELDIVTQEIFYYRFGAGMKIREIAECLDMPLSSVNTKLRRTLMKIRKRLKKKGVEYPF